MSYNQLLRQNTKTQNRTDIAIFRDNLKKILKKISTRIRKANMLTHPVLILSRHEISKQHNSVLQATLSESWLRCYSTVEIHPKRFYGQFYRYSPTKRMVSYSVLT